MNNNKTIFISEVVKTLPHVLPKEFEDAEILVQEFNKLDDAYTAVTVKKKNSEGVSVCPGLNMDRFYDEYRKGTPFHEIMQKLVGIILTPAPAEILQNLHLIDDYEQVKPRLTVRVTNYEKNENVAKSAPYQMVTGDLMATVHCYLEGNAEGFASFIVSDHMLEKWGITEDELFNDAWKSSEALLPARVSTMFETLVEDGFEDMLPEEAKVDRSMLIVNNQIKTQGAACLFYPGVLDRVSKIFGGDFYALPSSVHEFIVVPGGDAQSLLNMVHEVNVTQVEPKDFLSDNVYHYDSKAGKLETIYQNDVSISVCS